MLQHSKNFARARSHTHARADENISLFGRTPNLQLYAQRANKLALPNRTAAHCRLGRMRAYDRILTTENIYMSVVYVHASERIARASDWSSHHQLACDSDIKRIIIFRQVRFTRACRAGSGLGAATRQRDFRARKHAF